MTFEVCCKTSHHLVEQYIDLYARYTGRIETMLIGVHVSQVAYTALLLLAIVAISAVIYRVTFGWSNMTKKLAMYIQKCSKES